MGFALMFGKEVVNISYVMTIFLMILYAAMFGITMKIADLLDEHGLNWFRGSKILFGFLWGLFGVLLILGDNNVANLMLAMNLAFIFRMRIDYFNHALATVMIVVAFLFFATLEPVVFSTFFLVFVIFGSIKDIFGDEYSKNFLRRATEFKWFYVVPTFIYSYVTSDWLVFLTMTAQAVAYDLTKQIHLRREVSLPAKLRESAH